MKLHKDDPEYRAYLKRVVDAAPPPTPEQRARLAEIFRAAARDKIIKATS